MAYIIKPYPPYKPQPPVETLEYENFESLFEVSSDVKGLVHMKELVRDGANVSDLCIRVRMEDVYDSYEYVVQVGKIVKKLEKNNLYKSQKKFYDSEMKKYEKALVKYDEKLKAYEEQEKIRAEADAAKKIADAKKTLKKLGYSVVLTKES